MARLFAIGKMMPPERAAFDGMKLASTNSVSVSAKPSPSDRLPSERMNRNAMRRPNPVLIMPRDMKNAASTSHTIGSPYPDKAVAMGWTPRITLAPTPSRTIAPPGSGCSVSPATVAKKIASRFQESADTPAGGGTAAIASPMPMTAAQRQKRARALAPGGTDSSFGGPTSEVVSPVGSLMARRYRVLRSSTAPPGTSRAKQRPAGRAR